MTLRIQEIRKNRSEVEKRLIKKFINIIDFEDFEDFEITLLIALSTLLMINSTRIPMMLDELPEIK
jgi:hypothetical protein